MIPGTRHLATALTWKPLAATTAGTMTWIVLTDHPSPLVLSAAAAAVAAATPFVLDDAAAATLRSSPTTLWHRRAQRISVVLPLLAGWWLLAFTIVSRSSDRLPPTAYTLQLAALLAVGLAASSTSSRADSDSARGGTLGALAVIICFGTAFLPERALQLVPADPDAPDAGRQLTVLLAVAVMIQLGASTDPAHRTPLRRRRLVTTTAGRSEDG